MDAATPDGVAVGQPSGRGRCGYDVPWLRMLPAPRRIPAVLTPGAVPALQRRHQEEQRAVRGVRRPCEGALDLLP